jgi:hypothetical protein
MAAANPLPASISPPSASQRSFPRGEVTHPPHEVIMDGFTFYTQETGTGPDVRSTPRTAVFDGPSVSPPPSAQPEAFK